MFDRLGVKIICLIVALLLWVQVASTVDVEKLVQLPVRVEGLADSLTVRHSRLPEEVGVRVRGSRLQLLLSQLVSRDLGHISLDLTTYQPGLHSYEVTVLDAVVNATAVEVVPPTTLTLDVQREVTRDVPVRLRTRGDFPDGYTRASRPEITPREVRVTGPERVVTAVREVDTQEIDVRRRRSSFSETVALQVPDPDVHLSPVEVDVSLGVDEIIGRQFRDVPVTVLSDLPAERIHLEPTHARVQVRGPATLVEALAPEEVEVILHIDESVEGVAELSGQVIVPDGMLSSTVEPASFQVVVDPVAEEAPAGGSDG